MYHGKELQHELRDEIQQLRQLQQELHQVSERASISCDSLKIPTEYKMYEASYGETLVAGAAAGERRGVTPWLGAIGRLLRTAG